MAGVRRMVRRGMERTGLIGPYYRWVERRIARETAVALDDGRPMPPADLITVVAGGGAQDWFSERGRAHAADFLRLAREHGLPDRPLDVLDFGCGCGRIARWLAPDVEAQGGRFTGSDINPRLVNWCARNLPGRYFVNGLRPPLKLPDASQDLIYAYSVLTHLTEDTARAWLAEWGRVLRPDGRLIATFHDESFADRLGPPEVIAGLVEKPYVVWNNALEGSNYMSTWTTRAFFTELAAPAFEVLAIAPGGGERPEQAIAILKPAPVRP